MDKLAGFKVVIRDDCPPNTAYVTDLDKVEKVITARTYNEAYKAINQLKKSSMKLEL